MPTVQHKHPVRVRPSPTPTRTVNHEAPEAPHPTNPTPIDICTPDADLHIWQSSWEAKLASFYASDGDATAIAARRQAVHDELRLDFQRIGTHEQSVGLQEEVLETRRCLLGLLEDWPVRMALGPNPLFWWSHRAGRSGREEMILSSARMAAVHHEWERILVPELRLERLADNDGHGFWRLVALLASPVVEENLGYGLVPNINFDAIFGSSSSQAQTKLERKEVAWIRDHRYRFLFAFVARTVNLLRNMLPPISDTTTAARVRIYEPSSEELLQPPTDYFGLACAVCRKEPDHPHRHRFCTKCKASRGRRVYYCSATCQRADWGLRHRSICGQPYQETFNLQVLATHHPSLPPGTPIGVQRQVHDFETSASGAIWRIAGVRLAFDIASREMDDEVLLYYRNYIISVAVKIAGPEGDPDGISAVWEFARTLAPLVQMYRDAGIAVGDPGRPPVDIIIEELIRDFEFTSSAVRMLARWIEQRGAKAGAVVDTRTALEDRIGTLSIAVE